MFKNKNKSHEPITLINKNSKKYHNIHVPGIMGIRNILPLFSWQASSQQTNPAKSYGMFRNFISHNPSQ
jgi:hypothetical protein